MASEIPTGFDQEAWDWIVADARAKLAWAKGNRPKRPRALVARLVATRKANEAKRKKERKRKRKMLNRDSFRQIQEQRKTTGSARWHVLAAMEPGHWYSAHDIAAAIGAPYRTAQGLLTFRLSRDEFVQRADNPAFVKIVANQFTVKPRAEREPMYLWALTDSGSIERKRAIEKLEALGRPEYRGIKNAAPRSP